MAGKLIYVHNPGRSGLEKEKNVLELHLTAHIAWSRIRKLLTLLLNERHSSVFNNDGIIDEKRCHSNIPAGAKVC
jgi:hypothetical protein